MTISREDINIAIQSCSAIQNYYSGPNPLSAGFNTEDPKEQDQIIAETWATWSSFTRTYFMGMLNSISGAKPLALELEIVKCCTAAEAKGGRMAIEVFWRRHLSRRAPLERHGAHSMNVIQRTILADDAINAEVFSTVERTMEQAIRGVLSTRRNFLRQLDPESDHLAGLDEDTALFFGGGRPARLSAKVRNENYDGYLLSSV